MAHMQAARNVGRRHHDAKGRGVRVGMTSEGATLFPKRVLLSLDLRGPKRLFQHQLSSEDESEGLANQQGRSAWPTEINFPVAGVPSFRFPRVRRDRPCPAGSDLPS